MNISRQQGRGCSRRAARRRCRRTRGRQSFVRRKKRFSVSFLFRSGIEGRRFGERALVSTKGANALLAPGKRARRRVYETSRGARRVKVSNEAVRTHHTRGARADGRARGKDTVTRARVRENSSRFGDISRENECVVDARENRAYRRSAGWRRYPCWCQRVGEDTRKQARGARGRSKVERRAVRRVPRVDAREIETRFLVRAPMILPRQMRKRNRSLMNIV